MTNCRHLLLAAALCAPAALAQTTTPPSDTDLLIGHYQRVEQELLAKDTSALNEAQRTARVRALALLRAYRERADFGVMRETDEGRKPYFVDDGDEVASEDELVGADVDITGSGFEGGAAGVVNFGVVAEEGEGGDVAAGGEAGRDGVDEALATVRGDPIHVWLAGGFEGSAAFEGINGFVGGAVG